MNILTVDRNGNINTKNYTTDIMEPIETKLARVETAVDTIETAVDTKVSTLESRISTLEQALRDELNNKEPALAWSQVDDIGCNGSRMGHEGSCVSDIWSGTVECPAGSIERASEYKGRVKHACYTINN